MKLNILTHSNPFVLTVQLGLRNENGWLFFKIKIIKHIWLIFIFLTTSNVTSDTRLRKQFTITSICDCNVDVPELIKHVEYVYVWEYDFQKLSNIKIIYEKQIIRNISIIALFFMICFHSLTVLHSVRLLEHIWPK